MTLVIGLGITIVIVIINYIIYMIIYYSVEMIKYKSITEIEMKRIIFTLMAEFFNTVFVIYIIYQKFYGFSIIEFFNNIFGS